MSEEALQLENFGTLIAHMSACDLLPEQASRRHGKTYVFRLANRRGGRAELYISDEYLAPYLASSDFAPVLRMLDQYGLPHLAVNTTDVVFLRVSRSGMRRIPPNLVDGTSTLS